MRDAILVVEDGELERELLFQIFGNDYDVILARDGKEALAQLGKRSNDIVIVLLDLMMPVLNGYQVLQVLKQTPHFKNIPVAMVTSISDPAMEVSCYTMGVVAVIHKPFVAQVVRRNVENIIEMYQKSRELQEALDEQTVKLNSFYDHLMDAVAGMVEFRGLNSELHIQRVKTMTQILVDGYDELFPEENLSRDFRDQVVRASAIHDIGKIVIPDSILLKPAELSKDEMEVMQGHTTKGCEILHLLTEVSDIDQYKIAYDICRSHHERYDGKGYPDGLSGDAIPLSAQFVSIIDVYDALLSKRVYKQPYSKEVSYNMIVMGECGVFNPKIMQTFKHVRGKLEKISDKLR